MRTSLENWSVAHEPAANTQATITKAAESRRYHVITGISASMGGGSASGFVDLTLKNGSTVVFSIQMYNGANAVNQLSMGDISIKIDDNTAATLEFDAAGGANVTQRVSMWGHTKELL